MCVQPRMARRGPAAQVLADPFEVLRAKNFGDQGRMIDLESAYMRDQLMLEILLDIRDLFSVTPAAPAPGGTALEKLEALRRLTRLR